MICRLVVRTVHCVQRLRIDGLPSLPLPGRCERAALRMQNKGDGLRLNHINDTSGGSRSAFTGSESINHFTAQEICFSTDQGPHQGQLELAPLELAQYRMDEASARDLLARQGFILKESRAAAMSLDSMPARLTALASADPALFLERYGAVLTLEELAHFDVHTENYEVRWHLRALRRPANERAQQIRNRRFRALAELEREGDFFSDHNMQRRAPLLYHQHVGRFVEQEQQAFADEQTLAERLLSNYDTDTALSARRVAEEAERLERQEEDDDDQEEDGDEDEEEDVVPHEVARAPMVVWHDAGGGPSHTTICVEADAEGSDAAAVSGEAGSYEADAFHALAEEHRAALEASYATGGVRLSRDAAAMGAAEVASAAASAAARVRQQQERAREELLRIMRERFLAGDEHEHFDYARRCDNNPAYDDHEQAARDAEERWFDDEDAQSTSV